MRNRAITRRRPAVARRIASPARLRDRTRESARHLQEKCRQAWIGHAGHRAVPALRGIVYCASCCSLLIFCHIEPPMRLVEELVELVPGERAHCRRTYCALTTGIFKGISQINRVVPAIVLIDTGGADRRPLRLLPVKARVPAVPNRCRVAAVTLVQVSVRRGGGCGLSTFTARIGRTHGVHCTRSMVRSPWRGRVVASGSVTLCRVAIVRHPCRAVRGWLARRCFSAPANANIRSPSRDAAAIGVGAFIGCLPIYGFHLLLDRSGGRGAAAQSAEDVSRREHFQPALWRLFLIFTENSRPEPGCAGGKFPRF